MSELDELECPAGHRGKWLLTESTEVMRPVTVTGPTTLTVNLNGPEYTRPVPDSTYLICATRTAAGHECGEEIPMPGCAVQYTAAPVT